MTELEKQKLVKDNPYFMVPVYIGCDIYIVPLKVLYDKYRNNFFFCDLEIMGLWDGIKRYGLGEGI